MKVISIEQIALWWRGAAVSSDTPTALALSPTWSNTTIYTTPSNTQPFWAACLPRHARSSQRSAREPVPPALWETPQSSQPRLSSLQPSPTSLTALSYAFSSILTINLQSSIIPYMFMLAGVQAGGGQRAPGALHANNLIPNPMANLIEAVLGTVAWSPGPGVLESTRRKLPRMYRL